MKEEINSLPPWAGEMEEGDFISTEPTYEVGKFFPLFQRDIYKDIRKMLSKLIFKLL